MTRKGKMKCNRTACQNDEQGWWNRYTNAYYCQPCAFKINAASTVGPILERLAKRPKRGGGRGID